MKKNTQSQSNEQDRNSEVERIFKQAIQQAAHRALLAVIEREVDIVQIRD